MSDDNKEGAGVPVALLMQDENSGKDGRRYNEWHASRPDARLNARDAADAIQLADHESANVSDNESCGSSVSDNGHAVMPAAPSDADARLLHAFGRRTAFEIGDHALPLMLGPNWSQQGCYGENNEWLCLRFNSIDERDEFRAAARAWENVARERTDAACQACGDSGVVTDTEGHKWPCYQRCAALSQTMQPQAERDAKTWAAYVAGIVETYLQANPAPEVREKAIAGIIERRLWALPSAKPQAEPAAGEQAGAVAWRNKADPGSTLRVQPYRPDSPGDWEKEVYAAPGAAIAAREQEDGDWQIDHSTGRPILTYKNCSVIEAEDAKYVLRLIAADRASREEAPDIPQAGMGDAAAEKLYTYFTDNHPTIHCNRFAPWSELGEAEKNTWRRKALKGMQPGERKEGAE